MLQDLIRKIQETEAEASRIISLANEKAAVIDIDAQSEIEKIKENTFETIAKKTKAAMNAAYKARTIDTKDEVQISVEKSKIDKAKKFLMDEFEKRYST